MPIPTYFANATVTNAKRDEMSDVIKADVNFNGEILPVEFRPITKHTFTRKLLILVDGIMFDELDADEEVVKWYFELKDQSWDNARNVKDAHQKKIRDIVLAGEQ